MLALALVIAACGDEGDGYFDATDYPAAACNRRDVLLGGRRELRVFKNRVDDVAPFTRSLQRYYRRHGLAFFMTVPPASTSLTYVLDTNVAELRKQLTARFPGVDFEDDAPLPPEDEKAITKFIADFVLAPMLRFVSEHGNAGTDKTNVIFLPQLTVPGTEGALGLGGEIAGLAISPALLAILRDPSVEDGGLWREASLDGGFTPMMFLDATVIGRIATREETARDLVMAHEFGHTGALVHRETPGNLMNAALDPADVSCADNLDADQMTTMQTTLGFAPTQQALRARTTKPRLGGVRFVREVRALLAGRLEAPPSFLRPLLDPVHAR